MRYLRYWKRAVAEDLIRRLARWSGASLRAAHYVNSGYGRGPQVHDCLSLEWIYPTERREDREVTV